MSDVSNIFMYFSLALVVLWTVRLANTKGKNPFLWGGVSLFLSLVPQFVDSWPALLGMGPMVVLIFMKSQRTAVEKPNSQTTITCPKCQAYHALGHTYCVNCGWELKRPFTEPASPRSGTATAPQIQLEPMTDVESADRVEHRTSGASTPAQPSEMKPETEAASPEVVTPEAASPEAVTPEAVTPEAVTPEAVTPEAVSPEAASPEPVTAEVVSTNDGGEGDREEVPSEPLNPEPVTPEPVAPEPMVSRPITPARFTEQGLDLLDLGKFQEAVDQFTKAIALDATYSSAWEHRAEAYARQGRNDKAAEDQLKLETLRQQSAE